MVILSKLFIAITLLASMASCGLKNRKRKNPHEQFVNLSESEQNKIIETCYGIISNWRGRYITQSLYSRILEKDYHDWTDNEKFTILNINSAFNDTFDEECHDVDFESIKNYGVKAQEEAETITPEELKAEEKKKMGKLAKFGFTIFGIAMFPIFMITAIGGQLIVPPVCYALFKSHKAITRPLGSAFYAAVTDEDIEEAVKKAISKLPKDYFGGVAKCLKAGPVYQMYKLHKRHKEEPKFKNLYDNDLIAF